MLQRLADTIGLREGEAARTGRLFGFVFLLTVGVVFSKAAQRGLFLAAYPRSTIPTAFVVSALCLALASFATSALAARFGPTRLAQALLAMVAVLFGLGRLALLWGHPALPFIIYVLVEVAAGVLLVQGWTMVTEALDVRSAKRLLPLIGNAAGFAWATGGFAASAVASRLGTATLLLLASVLLIGAAMMVGAVEHYDLGGRAARGARGTTFFAGARQGLRYVFNEPLLRMLAIFTIVSQLIDQVLDYQLFATVQVHYLTQPDAIAAFMGTFYGITGAAALLAPLTFSGRVLSRFGSARSMASVPGLVLAGSIAFFVFPSFAMIVAVRGAHRFLKQALGSPGRAQMQTAIPAVRRAQAGALLKGVLAPLFYAVGGAVLIILPPTLRLEWLSLATLVLGAAGLVVTARYLRPAYVSALRRSVDRRRLDLDEATGGRTAVLDAEHCSALAEDVRSTDAARAAFAVSLLATVESSLARGPLREACAHPSARVQAAALEALARFADPADAGFVAAVLERTDDDDVERACLGALATMRVHEAGEAVRRRAADDDLRVRALARACLVRAVSGHTARNPHDPAATASAGTAEVAALQEMLCSTSEEERAAAAWAMGEMKVEHPALTESFVELLADLALPVRLAALRASGHLGDPRFVRSVVWAFAERATAPAAFQAFAALGDDMIDRVEDALRGASPALLSRTAAALAAGHGPRGDALLTRLLAHENRVVRFRAARALAARRSSADWSQPPEDVVLAAARAELRNGYEYYALLVGIAQTDGVADFDIEPEYEFVANEIRVRIRQTERRLFGILALVADARIIRMAELQLRRRGRKEAARAVELLEHALDPKLAPLVVPFFERRSLRLRLDAVRDHFPVPEHYLEDPLSGIMGLDDPHLRRCALVCYRERIAAEYPEALEQDEPMLPLMERIYFLRSVPLFGDLSGEDLTQVAEIAEPREHPADDVIFHKGDPGEALYLIVRGTVTVRDGVEEIATLGPREFFGELAVLDHEPRSADTVCASDAELLRIAGPDLEELMERRPEIAREIIKVLARRLRASTEKLAEG